MNLVQCQSTLLQSIVLIVKPPPLKASHRFSRHKRSIPFVSVHILEIATDSSCSYCGFQKVNKTDLEILFEWCN